MTKLTCMIVEDEPVSQEILKKYIADYPALELMAVCSNAIEAGDELRAHSPDLIFLDINMPKISGLDFYRSLSSPPSVIFTTAYPEYAVSGFEVNAVDYLVKPFPFERFLKAMNKVHDLMKLRDKPDTDFILLQADKKMYKVNYRDILFVEAMGDYVKIFTVEKTLVVHHTLQKLQELLPLNSFSRIHKSYIISLQRIDYLEGNMVVINKHQIPIGQTYRTDFLAGLHKRDKI
jgi:DNA-binding LytR/AlgR family response regulator